VVGRIGRAHGVHGEMRVEVLTDVPERRFAPGSALFVAPGGDGSPLPVVVLSARPHHGDLLVRLDVTPDRDSAQGLTGQYLQVPLAEAAETDPDSYYEHQLVGLAVVTADGAPVGRVAALRDAGGGELLEVQGDSGHMHLVPFVADVIAAIDLSAGRITITPPPGLLE